MGRFTIQIHIFLWILLMVLIFGFILSKQLSSSSSSMQKPNIFTEWESYKDIKSITVYKKMSALSVGEKKLVTNKNDIILIINTIHSALDTVQFELNDEMHYEMGGIVFQFQYYNGQTSTIIASNQINAEDGMKVVLLSNEKESYTVECIAFSYLWNNLNYCSIGYNLKDIPVLLNVCFVQHHRIPLP